MDKLIINHLQGDLSLEDQHKLKQWLDEDEAHPVILEQVEKYWEQGELSFPAQKDRVHSRIKTAVADLPVVEAKEMGSTIVLKSILKYAAVILMASLLSIYLYTSFGPSDGTLALSYIEKSTETGQKITTVLSDGTRVKLNAGSKITVPETFTGETRKVRLEGEAFFEVVHNSEKPFIVHFGNQQVRVLGTSFNIKAYRNTEDKVVAVKTGKVAVKQGADEVSLTPNEAVVLNGSPLNVMKIEDPNLYFGWVDNQLTFNKVTLEEAMEAISKWYGYEYEMRRKVSSDKLYKAIHKDQNIREVMEIMSFTFEVQYEIKDKTIIIK